MKKLLITSLVVVLLAVGGMAIALYNLNPIIAQWKPALEKLLTDVVRQPVEFDKIEVSLLPRPMLRVSGIHVGGNLDGNERAITLQSIEAGVELRPLLSRKLVITSLAINAPTLRLERSTTGIALPGQPESPVTMSDGTPLGVGGAPIQIDLDHVAVHDGEICVRDSLLSVDLCISGVTSNGTVAIKAGHIAASKFTLSGKLLGSQVLEAAVDELHYDPTEQVVAVAGFTGNYGSLAISASGRYSVPQGQFELSASTPALDVAELLRLLPPGSLPKGLGLSSGSIATELRIRRSPSAAVELDGTCRLKDVAGTVHAFAFQKLQGAIHAALKDSLTSVKAEKLTLVAGEKQEAVHLALQLTDLPNHPSGEMRISLPEFSAENYAPLLEKTSLFYKESQVQANGALNATLVLKDAHLTSFDAQVALKDGSLRYQGFPVRGMHGSIQVSGAGAPEQISSEAFTLRVGKAEDEIGLAGTFSLGSQSGSGKVMSHKLHLSNVLPVLTAGTGSLSAYDPEAVLTGIGIHLKRGPGGNLSMVGQATVQAGRIRVASHPITGLSGQLRLVPSSKPELVAIESDALSFQVGSETPHCSLRALLGPGRAEVDCAKGQAFGGSIDLSARYEGPKNVLRLVGHGRDLDVSRVLQLAPQSLRGKLSGTLSSLAFDLSGPPAQLSQSLYGSGSVALKDGVLNDINLGRVVLDEIGKLPLIGGRLRDRIPARFDELFQSKDTPIRRSEGELRFQGSRVSTPEMLLVSDHYRISGRGSIGLNSDLDLVALITFQPELTAALVDNVRELARVRNRDGTLSLPLRLQGVLPRIMVVPDVQKIVELGAQRLIEDKADELFNHLLGDRQRGQRNGDRRPGILDEILRGGR